MFVFDGYLFLFFLLENGYIGVNTLMNWTNAESYCESTYNTTLATITSSTENALAIIAAVYSGATDGTIWIGFNDFDNEGTFEWLDGTRNDLYNYTNWASGEPNEDNGGEDCTQIMYHGNNNKFGTWNDLPCRDALSFVCNAYLRGM